MNRKGTRGGSYSRTRPLPDRIENLLRYYIECVRQDEGQPIRAPLHDSGKRFIPWPFPTDLSFLDDAEPRITLDSRFADEIKSTSAGATLLYGYPTYIEGRGGYASAIPLFTWETEYELNGRDLVLSATPDWPQMNPEYLKKLASSDEERQAILGSLGLLNTEDDPPNGLILKILERMADENLLQEVLEPLDPRNLSNPQRLTGAMTQGLINCAALFAMERPSYTYGLIRELEEMVRSAAPGWDSTAFATMLGEHEGVGEEEHAVVEVVPLNEEQREAVRSAVNSPLTAVTGPPGTGKSQIVVSMIADAYMRGRRVLFASKNNKAVDVVEARVADLAPTSLMVRTGSRFLQQLTQSVVSLLALRPSQSDRVKYEELSARYKQLQGQESDLWAELQTIREAHDRLLSRDKARSRFEKEYTAHEWDRIQNAKRLPDIDRLTTALQLTNRHIAASDSLLRRLAIGLSASGDRKRIRCIAVEAMSACSVIGAYPLDDQSWQAWRTWLARALSVAEALTAAADYRGGLAALRELRSRDEVARELRRVRNDMTDAGEELVALHARLAPDRLGTADRHAIGNFRALLEQLARGQMGRSEYAQLRDKMARLFPNVSRHIPAWCVTNLSARGSSLPLQPNLFDLLIIDEASQCDIPSALPLLYRSRRAVIIGDPRQLRHITKIDPRRSQRLLADHGWGDDDVFEYNSSLFDLSISRGAIRAPIMLQDHYRSHPDIVGFSNRKWYQGNLQIWTDYSRLKTPPGGRFGIRWSEVSGTARRPRGGSVFIPEEAEAVVDQVVDLLMNQPFDGTVGIVTPFRPQKDMIWERVERRVPSDVRNRAQLIVDTAHGFQGDERDIVLFSPCVSRDLPSGAHNFLKNTENLFNVAITRARSLLHVVGSRNACAYSEIPHIQQFASYCAEVESPYETTLRSDDRVGPGERPLYEALVARGLNPRPQYPVREYRLDLAIVSGETRIDVEADGVSTHLGSRIDVERDSRLTELGWRVVRFWNHQIRDDIDYCVQTVLDLVDPPVAG